MGKVMTVLARRLRLSWDTVSAMSIFLSVEEHRFRSIPLYGWMILIKVLQRR